MTNATPVCYASFRYCNQDSEKRTVTIYCNGTEMKAKGKLRETICWWIKEYAIDVVSINLIKNNSGERTEGVVWFRSV